MHRHTYIHTYSCVLHCSPASVGLTQARPNYAMSGCWFGNQGKKGVCISKKVHVVQGQIFTTTKWRKEVPFKTYLCGQRAPKLEQGKFVSGLKGAFIREVP